MKTELAEELMRKFYEDKAEAANKTYQKIFYETPALSDAEKDARKTLEEKEELDNNPPLEEKKFKSKRKLTPEEEEEDREFWKAYRKEKEKQKT